jgi:hypothetical protein
MTCERPIKLTETVDVARVYPYKPQMLSLERLNRRSRSRRSPPNRDSHSATSTPFVPPPSTSQGQSTSTDTEHTVEIMIERSSDEQLPPQSPSSSHLSRQSVLTTGLNNATADEPPEQISATIDLRKAGYLPGDILPVKIKIKHIKPIRSLLGVIVTLTRQTRFDPTPTWPIDPLQDHKAAQTQKHNEYYPKSRTGLGGLSLSSASTGRNFRKDLSQAIAPLIVDDKTLSCDVKATVRVPDDAFPSIDCVPGALISCRYFVEVVVDLNGKLVGQDRYLPGLNTLNLPTNYGQPGGNLTGGDQGGESMLATWGGAVVDTDQIRRVKSVVSCRYEILVGTVDSTRDLGKSESPVVATNPDEQTNGWARDESMPTSDTMIPPMIVTDDELYEEPESHLNQTHQQQQQNLHYQNRYRSAIPQPQIPKDEAELDEKTRMRLAEERLMPSAPGMDGEPSTSSGSQHGHYQPSAPPPEALYSPTTSALDDLDHDAHYSDPVPGYPPEEGGDGHGHHWEENVQLHSAAGDENAATDDKHELQRRRMLLEASAPPEADANDEEGHQELPVSQETPSVPAPSTSEPLPSTSTEAPVPVSTPANPTAPDPAQNRNPEPSAPTLSHDEF